jgi:hypothetical protein
MANYENKFGQVQTNKNHKKRAERPGFHSSFVGSDSPVWTTTELHHSILLYLIKNAIIHSSAFLFILHMDRWINRMKKTNCTKVEHP